MPELLFITSNTAGTHGRSIYRKMQLHNKQDVIDAINKAMGLNPTIGLDPLYDRA